jgi:hypothetical protein
VRRDGLVVAADAEAEVDLERVGRELSGRAHRLTRRPPVRPPSLASPLYRIARAASSTGFSVRWTMAVWFSFFTDHTSTALFGPNHWCAAPDFQP